MAKKSFPNLSILKASSATKYPQSPDEARLEAFDNQHPDQNYLVGLLCDEFTSLCPITGQPDFAMFEIIYVPRVKMVESKSLKLYLFSFRNHGEFHEDVSNRIFKDLWKLMDPKYMRLVGDFHPRGGIAIKPLVEKFGRLKAGEREEVTSLAANWDRGK